MEGSLGDDFFNFKWTSLLHLEFPGSSHMKVGHFQPYLFSDLPWSELGCDPLLHFLLGHLVSGHSVIAGDREVRESFLQIRKEGLAEGRVCVGFVSHH